jgi:hypothetical protein
MLLSDSGMMKRNLHQTNTLKAFFPERGSTLGSCINFLGKKF